MQDQSLTATQGVAPCCSDHVEGATCGIEEGSSHCTCGESMLVPISLRLPRPQDSDPASDPTATASTANEPAHTQRSGLLFVAACLTSPCCTPLFVPLGVALLAGTPLAFWLTPHLGWVYAALTIISVSSLILAVFSLRQRSGWSSRLFKRVT